MCLVPNTTLQLADPVEQCKMRIRKMVQTSLRARIGSVRAIGRYHEQGSRKVEDDYRVKQQVLGSGLNGGVRLAFGQKSRRNERFAVKTFDLKQVVAKQICDDLLSELEIHMTVDHPHIVQLVDIYEAPSEIHMVMECMDGGELFDRLIQKKKFSNSEAADTIRQILLTVAYLHGNNIVHRDLKPENFLFEKAGSSHVKVIDFGFSTQWKEGDDLLRTACGTLGYVAPEVLNKSYTKQADLFSVGVIAFALLAGYLPFDGPKQKMIDNTKAGKYNMVEGRWRDVSENARSFVMALLHVDPQQRLTARAALEHPWIAETRNEPQVPDLDARVLVVDCLRNFQQASRLQRACCSMISLSPPSSPVCTQFRTLFLKMDTRGTGTVQFEDFKKVLSDPSRDAQNDQLLENLFAALNKDEHGCVHYSDFLAAMQLATGRLSQNSVAEAFRRFDVANSGYITKGNFQELLSNSSEDRYITKGNFQELLSNSSEDLSVQQLLEDIRLVDENQRFGYSTFDDLLRSSSEKVSANTTVQAFSDSQKPHGLQTLNSCFPFSKAKKIFINTVKVGVKMQCNPIKVPLLFMECAKKTD